VSLIQEILFVLHNSKLRLECTNILNLYYCYSNKEEVYRHLSIDIVSDDVATSSESTSSSSSPPVVPKASVEESLRSFFKPEVREIKCEKCTDGTEASQTLRIISRYIHLDVALVRSFLY